MDEQLKSNLTSGSLWLRGLYMVFFAICLQVAGVVMWVLVVLQFVIALISGEDNENLRSFGQSLSKYVYQALCFLSFNSEDKPFPFADWPIADQDMPIEGDVELAEQSSDDEVGDESDAELEEELAPAEAEVQAEADEPNADVKVDDTAAEDVQREVEQLDDTTVDKKDAPDR